MPLLAADPHWRTRLLLTHDMHVLAEAPCRLSDPKPKWDCRGDPSSPQALAIGHYLLGTLLVDDLVDQLAEHGENPMGANCGMRRDAWQRLGGFAESYVVASEDVELFWRAQLEGYEIGYAAGAVVHYRLPDSVRGLARQAFAYGRSHPRLYRDFARFGMPRSAPRAVLRQWAWLASHPLSIARGRGARGLWLSRLALRLGRLAGSIQNRVVYL